MRTFVALLMTLGLSAPAIASAELNIVDTEALQLDLGAYVNMSAAYSSFPYDTEPFFASGVAANGALLRLEWKAAVGENVTIDVHDRLSWSSPGGASFGAFATAVPDRSINLRTDILGEPGQPENGATLEHDLDRLAVTILTPVADVTVGRQAITWGNSMIFNLGDIWTQFNPFERDTSQKRGIDAVRVLSYPGEVELDILIVDRGPDSLDADPDAVFQKPSLEKLSGGVRGSWTLGDADYYAAAAKNYDSVWGLMGFAIDVGVGRLHGEFGLPLALELENEVPAGLRLPRATVGFDWFQSSKFIAFAEYHFNGPGTNDSDEYLAALSKPEFARGEEYFMGRHYSGVGLSYMPYDDLLTLTLSTVANLSDPSALLAPSVSYAVAQNVTATLGGSFGLGEHPDISVAAFDPRLNSFVIPSEYGLTGYQGFLQLSGFF